MANIIYVKKWFETMGQGESREDRKRASLGSNQAPTAMASAHHPNETRSSTPTPRGSGRTKNRRASLEEKSESQKEDSKKGSNLPVNFPSLIVPGVIIPVIDQIRGRRSRRPSADQGPLNMKSPTQSTGSDPLFQSDLPEIPPHEIFVPETDEEVPFRHRASTIGNGQIPILARRESILESSAELNKLDRSHIKVPVVLRYTKTKMATKRVFLAGSMTNWKTVEMGHITGETTYDIVLECVPGKYYYKFCVDNEWVVDESLPMTSYFKRSSGSQKSGSQKSSSQKSFSGPKTIMANVIKVKAEDNEVFEALACDSFSIKPSDNRFPEKEWGQNRPNFDAQVAALGTANSAGPPILPPHLLNIVLNKDTPDKSDPVSLPEPTSHVMLNHLYAQSIRDQMLVMATTARYKKK